MLRARLAFLSLVTSVPLAAQGTWVLRSQGTAPPAASASMTFDGARSVSVLATVGAGPTVQAWEWNGSSWSLRGSFGSQYPRPQTAAAFDSGRGVTVVFAGMDSARNGGTNQLGEWNGAAWNAFYALNSPAGRSRHALAFHGDRNVTVLFGGAAAPFGSGPNLQQDTWTWDGAAWTQRNPLSSPTRRAGHAMAYDSTRRRTVLFGGGTGNIDLGTLPPETFFGDTWEWDGSIWLERTPQSGPSPAPRHEHSMAYDPVAGVTYLFGGLDAAGQPLNDLWSWDGTAWTLIAPRDNPARRFDAAMVFDAARGRLVLYGGTNVTWSQYQSNMSSATYLRDTWEYVPGIPGSYVPFGSGCPGTRGTPALRAQAGSAPVAGRTFVAQVDNLPLIGPVFAFLGASDTMYGTLPLPYPLAGIGMPGCTLLASGDVLVVLQNVLGTAIWTVDIPAAALGATLFQQAIVGDPGANAAGLTLSNGARLTVGG